jgi:hypothetical protein
MGPKACAQKGSCRWKLDKCALLLADCCMPCADTLKQSNSYLSNHQELWYGVCLWLPQADGSIRTQSEPPPTQLGRPIRQRMKTDRLVDQLLSASKDKMKCDRSGKAYLHKATAHAIRTDLYNPAIDRAIAERFQAIYNRDIAPDSSSKIATLSLPKGGKSKGARSKQRQTFGAIINGATRSFSRGKATPTRYRSEGMANAVKSAPRIASKRLENGK